MLVIPASLRAVRLYKDYRNWVRNEERFISTQPSSTSTAAVNASTTWSGPHHLVTTHLATATLAYRRGGTREQDYLEIETPTPRRGSFFADAAGLLSKRTPSPSVPAWTWVPFSCPLFSEDLKIKIETKRIWDAILEEMATYLASPAKGRKGLAALDRAAELFQQLDDRPILMQSLRQAFVNFMFLKSKQDTYGASSIAYIKKTNDLAVIEHLLRDLQLFTDRDERWKSHCKHSDGLDPYSKSAWGDTFMRCHPAQFPDYDKHKRSIQHSQGSRTRGVVSAHTLHSNTTSKRISSVVHREL